MIKNVAELIEELQKVEDKTKSVYVFIRNIELINCDIMSIDLVDDSINDRVNINI